MNQTKTFSHKKSTLLISTTLALLLSACGGDGGPSANVDSYAFPQRGDDQATVTQTFGPLVVQPGHFDAQAASRPWSSWWYPLKKDDLFVGQNGDLSPLEKYDLYMRKAHGVQSDAAGYERDHLYNPDAESWEGLCNAWSAASILEKEPTKDVNIKGVDFKVADLKALLIKNYEVVSGSQYFGHRYTGHRGDDFNAIYPDQLHKLVQREIFENSRAFIVDRDPGIEVWNTPMYQADLDIKPDESDAHVMHVTLNLLGADMDVAKDFVGTQSFIYSYTYDLYGNMGDDGQFTVVTGVWTGDSADHHPAFGTILQASPAHHSLNLQIDPKMVDEIVNQARAQQ
jgi:hypothetical protein